jgi:hypothetical protein
MLKNEQIIHIPTEFRVDGISCQQNSVSTEFRGYPTVHLVEKFIFYEAMLKNEQNIHKPTKSNFEKLLLF